MNQLNINSVANDYELIINKTKDLKVDIDKERKDLLKLQQDKTKEISELFKKLHKDLSDEESGLISKINDKVNEIKDQLENFLLQLGVAWKKVTIL